MKIAITSHGNSRHALGDSRLSQAKYLMVYDTEADTWDCLPSSSHDLSKILAEHSITILITGYASRNLMKSLQGRQINLYSFGDTTGSVETIAASFRAGKLTRLLVPNALDIKSATGKTHTKQQLKKSPLQPLA